MPDTLNDDALKQIFLGARTFNQFLPRPLDEPTLRRLVDLLKWGPTSMNTQPGRFVFVRSAAAKERLRLALSPGNVDKTLAAPVTVIVAYDTAFYDHLPTQFPANEKARGLFANDPQLATATAFRNGTLQGAYLIIAARALGLDCGPMSGFNNAKVDAAFFPDGLWKSNFLVNIGYGDPSGTRPRGPRLAFDVAARIV